MCKCFFFISNFAVMPVFHVDSSLLVLFFPLLKRAMHAASDPIWFCSCRESKISISCITECSISVLSSFVFMGLLITLSCWSGPISLDDKPVALCCHPLFGHWKKSSCLLHWRDANRGCTTYNESLWANIHLHCAANTSTPWTRHHVKFLIDFCFRWLHILLYKIYRTDLGQS